MHKICNRNRNRNRNVKTSKGLLESQTHNGTSLFTCLFTCSATNQRREFPKGSREAQKRLSNDCLQFYFVPDAVLANESVKECPGVEKILKCNPPCSYKLETIDGIQGCTINYSTGEDVDWSHFYPSSAKSFQTGSVLFLFMQIVIY